MRLLTSLRNLLTRRRIASEADDELQFHIEQETAANAARGMSATEARRVALRDLGGVTQTREAVRDVRAPRFESVWQDLRHAVRSLRRERGFSLTVILTVALGIAASTTMFSVVNGVLLRPLPYAHAERVFAVSEGLESDRPSWASALITGETFEAWREQGRTIDGIAAYGTPLQTLRVGGEAIRLRTATVSASLFDVLGVRPARGRFLLPEEDAAGARAVVVISDALWRDRFSRDESVVGTSVVIDEEPHTIVGVSPPEFYFPDRDVAMWISHARRVSDRWRDQALVRLRADATVEQAAAEATVIAARAHPELAGERAAQDDRRVRLIGLLERQTMTVRRALLILLAAGAAVLLIVIANTASLFLLRSLRRRRELAVSAALGASRRRIAQAVFVHAAVIGLAGGALGVAMAAGLRRLLVSIAPADFPRLDDIVFDARVMLFAVMATLAAVVVSALAPAWRAMRQTVTGALRGDVPDARGTLRVIGIRSPNAPLLIAELALSCTLVIVAGLLGRGFASLMSVDPGYAPANVLTAQVSFPMGTPRERQREVTETLLRLLSGNAAVSAVGMTNALPLETVKVIFDVRLGPQAAQEQARPDFRVVSPGYFETVGMRVVAGRAFTWQDRAAQSTVAVVNETFVRRYLAGETGVGAQLPIGSGQPWSVIGVVRDVRYGGLDKPVPPTLYTSFLQREQTAFFNRIDVVVRPAGSAAAFVPALRRAVHDVDDRLALYKVSTMADQLGASVASPRLYASSMIAFAVASMAIAAIGLYGTLAYAAARRRREVAIRVALGADAAAIARLVARDGVVIALIATATGCGLGYAASQLLRGLLFGVAPTDPVTFGLASVLIALAAACASISPIRHALRLQPASILKGESS